MKIKQIYSWEMNPKIWPIIIKKEAQAGGRTSGIFGTQLQRLLVIILL